MNNYSVDVSIGASTGNATFNNSAAANAKRINTSFNRMDTLLASSDPLGRK